MFSICADVQLTDELKTAIQSARSSFLSSTSKLDVDYVMYKTYGKEYLKQKKLSPDSFMQLAFQVNFIPLLVN
jgi:hypothetical protein